MPNEIVRRRKQADTLAPVTLPTIQVIGQIPEPVPTLRPGGALFMAGALALALYFLSRAD